LTTLPVLEIAVIWELPSNTSRKW